MKDKYNIADDEDYLTAVSATDCTGLIPANNADLESMEVYKDLYPFGAPEIKEENIDKSQKLK